MPLVIAVNGTPAPALALEVLRVATGEKQYSIRTNRNGVIGVQIGNSLIRTDPDGRLRLYFSPAYADRQVSAAAILKGEVKVDALAGQVAIIGATALGVSDVVATPSSSRTDGVEIQAQLVENMLEGSRLQRPPCFKDSPIIRKRHPRIEQICPYPFLASVGLEITVDHLAYSRRIAHSLAEDFSSPARVEKVGLLFYCRDIGFLEFVRVVPTLILILLGHMLPVL